MPKDKQLKPLRSKNLVSDNVKLEKDLFTSYLVKQIQSIFDLKIDRITKHGKIDLVKLLKLAGMQSDLEYKETEVLIPVSEWLRENMLTVTLAIFGLKSHDVSPKS